MIKLTNKKIKTVKITHKTKRLIKKLFDNKFINERDKENWKKGKKLIVRKLLIMLNHQKYIVWLNYISLVGNPLRLVNFFSNFISQNL